MSRACTTVGVGDCQREIFCLPTVFVLVELLYSPKDLFSRKCQGCVSLLVKNAKNVTSPESF